MKKFWKIFGWICLGIFIQFKFNPLYGIVFLENLNFHDRAYYVTMQMIPTPEKMRILKVETIVHHSLGKDYFANVYIPDNYKVLNKEPYLGAESLPGYKAYSMNMKRKYRDVLSREEFMIVNEQPDSENSATPILVQFQNLKQLLHQDDSYHIASNDKDMTLTGPKRAEAVYPQQLGM